MYSFNSLQRLLNMFLLNVIIFLIISNSLINCEPIRSGVFENVTVFVKGQNNKEETVFIEFDDNLSDYLNNKPTEIIIIQNQFIPKLETNSIANIPKVQNLSLINNGIREIRPGSFKNLPDLKVLNLSYNVLEEIKCDVFNHLVVDDLDLRNNEISKIGYKAFRNLQMRNLYLNNNKISRWSKDWFYGSSVNVLNMGYNFIEELPPRAFHLMVKPTDSNMTLIFTNNRIKKINNNTFQGFDVYDSIFLDSNLIDHLETGVFNGVKHINTLNLNNNSLSEINSSLLRNTRVDILMLEDNKLKCISTDIFQMEELDIDGNPITCFCVKTWISWRDHHSNPSIYHITNLEEECI